MVKSKTRKKVECDIQITIFLHSLGCNLSDCILNLFGKILEQEIFQVKVRTPIICVGWTRSGSERNWAIKPEPYTKKGCLKVQITLFWCSKSIKSTHITQNVVSCEVMGKSHFAPNQQNLGVLGHNLWTRNPKWMFFGWNHFVLRCLIHEKKNYNPEFSLVWKLVALVCPKYSLNGTRVHEMVCDHNLWTTDGNFMFSSIFTMF